jgi:hypothetical protein
VRRLGRRNAQGPALIEELPGLRCPCGAPLFQLVGGGRIDWVRCLAGHIPPAGPREFAVGASLDASARAWPPRGWAGEDGDGRATRAVARPGAPPAHQLLPFRRGASSSPAARRD